MSKFFPLIFVILWSSAFVTTLPIVLNSDPFSALAFRFFFVALCFFLFCKIKKFKTLISFKDLFNSFSTGILFHGFYLGGVFYAIFIGLPTAIVALIVTLQPILTNILAGPLLKEKILFNQWIGISMGFLGSVLVIGLDIGKSLPMNGILAAIIALLAITSSTIWQKKVSNNIPLGVNNLYQAIGAFIFHLLIFTFIFEEPFLNINPQFLLAMSHQVFLVSLGAFSILMYLIKKNSASKTVSLFFLIPIVTAFMAWLFLDENLTTIDLIGFIIASIGVFIATRK